MSTDYYDCRECGETDIYRKNNHDCPGNTRERIDALEEEINELEEKVRKLEKDNDTCMAFIAEMRTRGMMGGIILKGWECKACRRFNGEEKEKRWECSACGAAKRDVT